tara:strand:+ start:34892 stop:36493 length:1602 start_codon:yes stop_codon:yes gene_type:complete
VVVIPTQTLKSPLFIWAGLCAGLVILPVLWLATSWAEIRADLWQHLIETQILELIWNTLRLILGVFIGVSLLGTSLAWIVTKYEFPGRSFFEWALVLPFAIPAYVFAFIFIGTFDGASTPMNSFRQFSGLDIWPQVRNYWGVLISFVCAFYPYVYLLVRGRLKRQGQEIYEVAQTLGCKPIALFFRVALPIAWPAVVGGAGLAVMETMADFGAVSIFNYQTFTTAIYKSWFGFFSLQTAAQLASMLVVAVIVWRSIEAFMLRGRDATGEKTTRSRAVERFNLSARTGWLITFLFTLLFSITFIVPMFRLVMWVGQAWSPSVLNHFYEYLSNSLILSVAGGILVVFCSLFLAIGTRQDGRKRMKNAVRFATLGYALPGSILAVGLMMVVLFLQKKIELYTGLSLALVGGVGVLLTAYVVRFLAVGYSGAHTAVTEVQPHIGEAAQVLGVPLWRRVIKLYCPLVSPGLFAALLLVIVDILKEMPATLLLRPFGWDTLAVSIFGFTAEGDWALAALPALALVLIGLVPVYILIKRY